MFHSWKSCARKLLPALLILVAGTAFGYNILRLDKPWQGVILSYPKYGSGLVVGWAERFESRAACKKWELEQRVAAGRGPATITHDITGGCTDGN